MKSKQLKVLLVAVSLFSLSELFPPWLYEYSWHRCPAGYGFITNPPAVKSSEEMQRLCHLSDLPTPESFTVHKHLDRLNFQRIILTLLMVGLLLRLDERRSTLKIALSAISLGIVIAGLISYAWFLREVY